MAETTGSGILSIPKDAVRHKPTAADLTTSPFVDPPRVFTSGPGSVGFNTGSFGQVVDTAKVKGLTDAANPRWVDVSLVKVAEGTLLVISPVEPPADPDNPGGAIPLTFTEGDRVPVIRGLHAFFRRVGIDLASDVVRVARAFVGEDPELGPCVYCNLTTAELRQRSRREGGEAAGPASPPPGATP